MEQILFASVLFPVARGTFVVQQHRDVVAASIQTSSRFPGMRCEIEKIPDAGWSVTKFGTIKYRVSIFSFVPIIVILNSMNTVPSECGD
eukprot:SAG31_NODE_671_length_12940_cov_4.703606_7_plen_89_part_00